MEHKYIVVQSMYKNGDITRIGFGIAAVEEYDGVTTILKSILDISSDIEPIESLVEIYNNLQLDTSCLQDVARAFCATFIICPQE